MKAITIYNPWAMFIPWGEKTIETRSWYTSHRGPLAIHASKTVPSWVKRLCYEEPYRSLLKIHGISSNMSALAFGSVVGISNLIDCRKITPAFVECLSEKERQLGDYALGRYAWILNDCKGLITPIPAKGTQNLWTWEPPVNLQIA